MDKAEDIVRRVAELLAGRDPAAALDLCTKALGTVPAMHPLHPTLQALAAAATVRARELDAALRDRERMDMFSRASFEGLVMHVDGVVIAANARFAEIVGYDEDEVIGLNALQIMVAPESQPEVLRRMSERIEGSYLITGIRKDGTRFPAELSSKQSHLGERPVRVVGVRDVSSREETARRLREGEERLRRLIGHTFDVTTISRDGVLVEITGNVEALFGRPAEALVGRSVEEFVAPSSRDQVRAVVAQRSEGPYEAELLRADGVPVPVLVVSTPASLDGQDVRIAGLRDLRDARRAELQRRELELQVERAQRLESLGVLAGGIAHDFNNLLVGIMGNADLIRSAVAGTAHEAALDGIVAASERAAGLTSQMLAYAGHGSLEQRTAVELEALIQELGSLLRVSTSKKAELTLDFCPERSMVVADQAALGQVILNLLTNASDALEGRTGRILVRTLQVDQPGTAWLSAVPNPRPDQAWVLLEVSDSGSGMDEPTAARIFEPFFTTKEHGHGLGLAACLGIVRSHGGAIRVESEPGQGTSFFVLLPRQAHEAQAPATESPRAPSVPQPRAVLVVDDEVAIRTFVRTALEYADFEVDEASDGEEALERLAVRDYDLMLLDLSMPKLDGIEVVRRMRANGNTVPVILTSGYSDTGIEARLEPGSFQGFLRKPYRVSALYEAIRTLLPNALPSEG